MVTGALHRWDGGVVVERLCTGRVAWMAGDWLGLPLHMRVTPAARVQALCSM